MEKNSALGLPVRYSNLVQIHFRHVERVRSVLQREQKCACALIRSTSHAGIIFAVFGHARFDFSVKFFLMCDEK
ncbi:MAG TPA: hypothetical protein DCO65_04170 [Spartobacteria bacterium]|nr:hypothetical protein [Spartobacteria bacterium]HAK06456.1 hypothetical protein [Spartobacteria bacterium]HCP92118.1 hypothetical protein [Spartobacteria bacterium]